MASVADMQKLNGDLKAAIADLTKQPMVGFAAVPKDLAAVW